MNLTAWARHAGIHPKTARLWFHQSVLPVPARQLSTGTILADARPETNATGTALYARVSPCDQKAEAEVGSGLIGRRRRLTRSDGTRR